MVGSWIAYAVGYYGRVDILEKHGKKLHIKPSHLAWADRWFERYGDATVFFSRMLPIIRTFISLPAGVARMPFWRFTVLTTLGCIPWVFMLTFIGKQVGDNWESWKDNLHYVDYAVAAVIVLTAPSTCSSAGGATQRRAGRRCRRAETIALGLLQGPAELLPVSSSAHVGLLPWALGWRHAALPGAERKEVEVALHAGTALALALVERRRPRWALLAAATVPPALAGLLLERPIEARLGTPPTIAAGLLAGSVAMVLADRTPARAVAQTTRTRRTARGSAPPRRSR